MHKSVDLVDSFVTLENKLARLKQNTLKLVREEYAVNRKNEAEESAEVKMEEAACPKCRGDGDESSIPHIQDLCPADKKRIAQLVAELARCTQDKHKAEADMAVSKAETEALQNRFKLFSSQHEDDKSQLRSELSDAKAEMRKLKKQTSNSLELLTGQIMALESQSTKLTETVKDLLNDKVQLQDALNNRKMRARAAESKMERMRESMEMEKIVLMKEHVKSHSTAKTDKECQTGDKSEGSTTKSPSTESNSFNTEPIAKKQQKTTQTKSKHDLDAPSSDAKLLRELFFKQPNVDETESLEIFPMLPES